MKTSSPPDREPPEAYLRSTWIVLEATIGASQAGPVNALSESLVTVSLRARESPIARFAEPLQWTDIA